MQLCVWETSLQGMYGMVKCCAVIKSTNTLSFERDTLCYKLLFFSIKIQLCHMQFRKCLSILSFSLSPSSPLSIIVSLCMSSHVLCFPEHLCMFLHTNSAAVDVCLYMDMCVCIN